MRRLRDAGIVTMLLLGLTGCAGVQQRLGWTEPPYQGDEDTEGRPLSRLAFCAGIGPRRRCRRRKPSKPAGLQ